MRLSIELVVVAIIILVIAVVMITIFGAGITQVRTATDARANCLNQGKFSCETSGSMPPGWDTIPVFTETRAGGQPTSMTCKDLTDKTAEQACTSTYDANLKITVHKWNIE